MAGNSQSTTSRNVVEKNSQTGLSRTWSIALGAWSPWSAMALAPPAALGGGLAGQHQGNLQAKREQVTAHHPAPERQPGAEGVRSLRQQEGAGQHDGQAHAGGAQGGDQDVLGPALPGELGPDEGGGVRHQTQQQGGAREQQGLVAAAKPAGRQPDQQPEGQDAAQ